MATGGKRGLAAKLEALETFTVEVIYGRATGLPARLWGGFLRALSLPFGLLVALRQWLYRKRVLRAQHLGCLVIVVGNLTVGGTGKTPVVERLARSLQARGRRVAILSRGYKSRPEPLLSRWWRWLTQKEVAPPRIVSDGERVLLGSEVAGDEPYMLARNLPGVVVLTDKDRVKAGAYAIRHFEADTLILDDGFQYYRMQDHVQVLLVDKTNPFGNGALLPRGILREPVSQMARASYVFLTKSDGREDAALVETLSRYRGERDWVECKHEPQFLAPVISQPGNGQTYPLESLRGRRVAALSAIAAPESFEHFLTQLGAEIVLRQRYLDHHRFEARELAETFAQAHERGADWVVTTEKDAVRIDPECRCPLPFYYLRVEIELLTRSDSFDAVVERICFPEREIRPSQAPFTQPPQPA